MAETTLRNVTGNFYSVGATTLVTVVEDVMALNGPTTAGTFHLVGYSFDGTITTDSYGTTTLGVDPDLARFGVIYTDSESNVGDNALMWIEPANEKLVVWDIYNGATYSHTSIGDTFCSWPYYVAGWIYWAHGDSGGGGANAQLKKCRTDCTDIQVVSTLSASSLDLPANVICTSTELMWLRFSASNRYAKWPLNGSTPTDSQTVTPLGSFPNQFQWISPGSPSSATGACAISSSGDTTQVTEVHPGSFAETAAWNSGWEKNDYPHYTPDGSKILSVDWNGAGDSEISDWVLGNTDGTGASSKRTPDDDSRGNPPWAAFPINL